VILLTVKERKGEIYELTAIGPEAQDLAKDFRFTLPLGPRNLRDDVALPPVPELAEKIRTWALKDNSSIKTSARFRTWIMRERQRIQRLSSLPIEDEVLYPFQREGVAWIKASAEYHGGAIRCLIADDPRLGKSIQALYAIRGIKGPVLILCLKSLMYQWYEYVKEWLPERKVVAILKRSEFQRQKRLELALSYEDPVIIANWETVHMDIPDLFDTEWSVIIGDEAHCLKTRPSRSRRKRSHIVNQVKNLKSEHMLLLSGTFVEKTPADWWQPLNILYPKIFASFWTWVSWYVTTRNNGFGTVLKGAKNTKLMRLHLAPYVLRRRIEDVANVPQITSEDLLIEMPDDHRKLYDQVKKDGDFLSEVARIVKLRQITVHPALIDSSCWDSMSLGKYEALRDLVQSVIPDNEQIIIYSTFVDGAILASNITGGEVFAGDIAAPETIGRFKSGVTRILCSTPGKGGVGLNLYNANYVVYIDCPWSSIQWRQSRDRAVAIGKTSPIMVYTLVTANTIDEYVVKTLMRKLKVISESDVFAHVRDHLVKE